MSIYAKLEKLVLPKLTHYKSDLTKLDKEMLEGFEGKFLYGHSNTGTDIFLMENDLTNLKFGSIPNLTDIRAVGKSINAAIAFVLRSSNECLYIGDTTSGIKKSSRSEIKAEFEQFIERVAKEKADYVFNDTFNTNENQNNKKRELYRKQIKKEVMKYIEF